MRKLVLIALVLLVGGSMSVSFASNVPEEKVEVDIGYLDVDNGFCQEAPVIANRFIRLFDQADTAFTNAYSEHPMNTLIRLEDERALILPDLNDNKCNVSKNVISYPYLFVASHAKKWVRKDLTYCIYKM